MVVPGGYPSCGGSLRELIGRELNTQQYYEDPIFGMGREPALTGFYSAEEALGLKKDELDTLEKQIQSGKAIYLQRKCRDKITVSVLDNDPQVHNKVATAFEDRLDPSRAIPVNGSGKTFASAIKNAMPEFQSAREKSVLETIDAIEKTRTLEDANHKCLNSSKVLALLAAAENESEIQIETFLSVLIGSNILTQAGVQCANIGEAIVNSNLVKNYHYYKNQSDSGWKYIESNSSVSSAN